MTHISVVVNRVFVLFQKAVLQYSSVEISYLFTNFEQLLMLLLSNFVSTLYYLTQCASKKDHLRNMKIANFQNLFRDAWGCW